MSKHILITGGAGFVGSHLADGLLAAGHSVRILDDLHPQVHTDGRRPDYLSKDVELVVGDVRYFAYLIIPTASRCLLFRWIRRGLHVWLVGWIGRTRGVVYLRAVFIRLAVGVCIIRQGTHKVGPALYLLGQVCKLPVYLVLVHVVRHVELL